MPAFAVCCSPCTAAASCPCFFFSTASSFSSFYSLSHTAVLLVAPAPAGLPTSLPGVNDLTAYKHKFSFLSRFSREGCLVLCCVVFAVVLGLCRVWAGQLQLVTHVWREGGGAGGHVQHVWPSKALNLVGCQHLSFCTQTYTQVRGPTYLADRVKTAAGVSAYTLLAVDLVSTREAVQHIARFLPSVR